MSTTGAAQWTDTWPFVCTMTDVLFTEEKPAATNITFIFYILLCLMPLMITDSGDFFTLAMSGAVKQQN